VSFKLPADISRLSDAEVADLLAEGDTEFRALLALDDPTLAEIAEAERIKPLLRTLKDEAASRTASAASRAERMAALREPDEPEPVVEPEPTVIEAAPVEAAAEVVPPVVVEVTPIIHREDLVQASDESDAAFRARQGRYPARETTVAASVPEAAEVVAAPSVVATLAGRTARPERPTPDASITIVASADVPEFATGSKITDLMTVGKATVNRMKGFPPYQHNPNAEQHMYGVASFRMDFPEELILDGGSDDYAKMQYAARESRLPNGNLAAAGGWCAPSTVLYDLCEGETTDGILSLPEVAVPRGGLKTTKGPDFSTIYSSSGFQLTEAQVIAGTPAKTCYEVPCPAFTEVRLDAVGMCIKSPILTNSAYPELVERVVRGSLIAHQHQINVRVISTIQAALGTAVVAQDLKGVAGSTLNALELLAEATRSKYRLSFNETLEVIAPHWLLSAIRTDVSMRTGQPMQAISNAEINSLLAARGVSVQWVYGYQDLAAACPVAYPATVELLLYPAGTFIKGTSAVINMSAVYDAASLLANMYTALFMEEGVLVTQSCFSGCKVTIPICTAGRTGINDVTCP
jgi:hypothetical protein